MLTVGLIGLPVVGKTTIFNLLTCAGAQTSGFLTGRAETNIGIARVPDPRIDFLSRLYNPRRITHAQIQYSDVPGLVRGAGQGKGVGNQFLDGIRNVDLLVHIVRAFAGPDVLHVDGSIDLLRDIGTVDLELLFADLELIDRRITHIQSGRKISKESAAELPVLKKCLSVLEAEAPIHRADLSNEERAHLTNYNFFTDKPLMPVVNMDEEQFRGNSYPQKEQLKSLAESRGLKIIEVCGQLEMEINLLEPEDQRMFLMDLGVEELGTARLSRAAYRQLNLISFFTVGPDEVKAWTIKQGTNARQAAGKVHSDMERGFIRAEIVKYLDLYESGSMTRIKEKGLSRLEGKDYIVEDGDIINFRFNV